MIQSLPPRDDLLSLKERLRKLVRRRRAAGGRFGIDRGGADGVCVGQTGGEAVHAGPEEEFRGGVERETRHEVLEGVVVVSVRTGQA